MKNKIMLFFLGVIMVVMLFLGQRAYTYAIGYEEITTELVGYQDVGQQASLQLEKLTKSLLGKYYEDKKKINIEKIRTQQQATMQKALKMTQYFMILLLISLLVSYFFLSLRLFTLVGSVSALLTLVLGLVTPVLMVTIHKEVEYLGDIVLSFESKGVIGSIAKLFEGGDVIVAIVILLFSVIVPVTKVLSLFFVSLFMQYSFAHTLVKFFKMIGKWSMVDVFVVAVFLVYLTANKGEVSRAEIEVGLYFFLAYVIVSMIVSITADKMLHSHKKETL